MAIEDKLGRFSFKGDKIVLILTILLSLISIYAVYSSTGSVLAHFFHLGLCFAGMFAFYYIDYSTLSKFSLLCLLLAAALLVITLLSGGSANRGISLFGVQVQTFYFIGFLVIFYISKFLAVRIVKDEALSLKETLYIFGVVVAFSGGMALTNMSTAIIFFITSLVVLFIGNVKLRYLSVLMGIALIGVLLYMNTGIGRGSTFKNRWEYYITNNNDHGYGDQMILAKAAIARSGLTPAGPGQGVIKHRLPESETDYVYATVFEEMGAGVGILILFFYLVLFYRAWKIAQNSEGPFGMLLAMGIGFWFSCQGLVHIGVNCELLPATGQTLPFISRGGASLLFSGIAVGILLNISKQKA
ncbi:MAG: FtsW/RodA/SpoVE family cell cycle protein [Bacteroidales bacterium]